MFDNKSMLTVVDTKNKYIFWDIDGTLAAYRYNDHVGDLMALIMVCLLKR